MRKKNFSKFKKGFSLIELSIVILVISFLTGSIIISSAIIKDANLASAQQMTANSPVSHINGLELWLETSLEDSLEYNSSSNEITGWNDLSGNGRNLTDNAGTPEFLEEGGLLKGVPSVYLNGTEYVFRDAIPVQRHTAFVVAKMKEGASNQYFFYNGTTSDGFGMGRSLSDRIVSISSADYELDDSPYQYDNIAAVFVARYNGTAMDGKVNDNPFPTNPTNRNIDMPTGNFQVGGSNMVEMEIAEIIIYNRALFDSEVDDIVSYLMKKYSID